MQAAGGDAQEEGADVAAEGKPGTIAEEQPADHRTQDVASGKGELGSEFAGEAGGLDRRDEA